MPTFDHCRVVLPCVNFPDVPHWGTIPEAARTPLLREDNSLSECYCWTGFARVALPAYRKVLGCAPLPLFGYCAVAAVDGEPYAAYLPIDAPGTWDPSTFHTPDLRGLVDARCAEEPDNQLVIQLARCALEYGCFTAQNIFYQRWEGALPASPACSAHCVGCISEQLGDLPSPQQRLTAAPSPGALAALAVRHLAGGPGRIVSFGQGCEGYSLNRWKHVASAIRLMRVALPLDDPHAGIINMNTNAWHTKGLQRCIEAGLQRIRVSIFSAIDDHYAAYYKPRGYTFSDVRQSIRLCVDSGLHVALNLLTFPGFTDTEEELDALLGLIASTGVQEVQVRTLNIDREMLRDVVPSPNGRELGIGRLLSRLREAGVRVATHAWIEPPTTPSISPLHL